MTKPNIEKVSGEIQHREQALYGLSGKICCCNINKDSLKTYYLNNVEYNDLMLFVGSVLFLFIAIVSKHPKIHKHCQVLQNSIQSRTKNVEKQQQI